MAALAKFDQLTFDIIGLTLLVHLLWGLWRVLEALSKI